MARQSSAKEKNQRRAIEEVHKLLARCQFLVHRAEFLHQQGLSFNLQAQEIARDALTLRRETDALQAMFDRLVRAAQKRSLARPRTNRAPKR